MPWTHGIEEIHEDRDINNLHIRCNALIQKIEILESKVETYHHRMQQKTDKLAACITIVACFFIVIMIAILQWIATSVAASFRDSTGLGTLLTGYALWPTKEDRLKKIEFTF
jgi:MFS superfamily sulfate permease-like transporter